MSKPGFLFDEIVAPFERRCGFRCCFHLYVRELSSVLGPRRSSHFNPCCECVKQEYGHDICMSFDQGKVREYLADHPNGFFKICHAGLLECVVPIREGNVLLGIVFIGLFRWDGKSDDRNILMATNHLGVNRSFQNRHRALPVLDAEGLSDVFSIGQALRLQLEQALSSDAEDVSGREAKMRNMISDFLRLNFNREIRLEDLANHIGLSVSRTSHVVKRLFDVNYPDLLNQYRVDYAKNLLTHSGMPLRKIAEECGFREVTYFHRIFRGLVKQTPGDYRNRHHDSRRLHA